MDLEDQGTAPAAVTPEAPAASQDSGSNTTDFLNEFSSMTSDAPAGEVATEVKSPVAPTDAPVVANPAEAGGVIPPAVPATTPAPTPVPGQEKPIDPMVEAVHKLTETLAKPKDEVKPEAKPGQEELPFTVPPYQFQIHEKLMEDLYSDDAGVRKTAMTTLLAANNQTVHKQVMTQTLDMVKEMLRHAAPHIIQAANMSQQQGGAQKQVFDDFYGKHPHLNHDAIKPIVLQTAQTLVKEGKFKTWNPEFRDLLAQRVGAIIQAATGQPATPPKPIVPVAAPPVMVQNRIAPAPTAQPSGIEADVLSLMDM